MLIYDHMETLGTPAFDELEKSDPTKLKIVEVEK